ncbi:MAG: chemotaxis protein CheW [Deltaproteobacteria bacterium CG_4_10_14_3_um_filter_60_8]|nr:MAG: chemotaxis protein CheW [Desulfobacterales bacterium CG2_30_60_27]PIY21056.1 MAG: chemotaxis protein CheW [Deltaproteobacteria bacterium CG_4_10_14_3_um_filter_60_8]
MDEAMDVKQEGGQSLKGLEGKYLTFALGKEEYGVGILKVREIIGVMEITAVPHTLPYVKGVINLRGRVIPVLDIRLKFGMPVKEYDERTCIIVVEIYGPSGPIQVGLLVDSVSEVLNVTAAEIEPPPAFGTHLDADYILGMAKVKDKVQILLDADRVVGKGVLETLETV